MAGLHLYVMEKKSEVHRKKIAKIGITVDIQSRVRAVDKASTDGRVSVFRSFHFQNETECRYVENDIKTRCRNMRAYTAGDGHTEWFVIEPEMLVGLVESYEVRPSSTGGQIVVPCKLVVKRGDKETIYNIEPSSPESLTSDVIMQKIYKEAASFDFGTNEKIPNGKYNAFLVQWGESGYYSSDGFDFALFEAMVDGERTHVWQVSRTRHDFGCQSRMRLQIFTALHAGRYGKLPGYSRYDYGRLDDIDRTLFHREYLIEICNGYICEIMCCGIEIDTRNGEFGGTFYTSKALLHPTSKLLVSRGVKDKSFHEMSLVYRALVYAYANSYKVFRGIGCMHSWQNTEDVIDNHLALFRICLETDLLTTRTDFKKYVIARKVGILNARNWDDLQQESEKIVKKFKGTHRHPSTLDAASAFLRGLPQKLWFAPEGPED